MSWRALRERLRPCPSGEQLSRAFSEGATPAFGLHVRTCVGCQGAWQAMQRVRDAASALPTRTLNDETQRNLSIQLGAAVSDLRARDQPARSAAPAAWAVIGAAVIGGAFVWAVLSRPREQPIADDASGSAVSIHAIGAVSFSRERPRPDELVRLREGTLQLEVKSLANGERLRIATADAELDVGKGRFEVSAVHDQLLGVRVWSGHTEVRGAAYHVGLDAGDEWTQATGRGGAPAAELSPASSNPTSPTSPTSPTNPSSRAPHRGHVAAVAAVDDTSAIRGLAARRMTTATPPAPSAAEAPPVTPPPASPGSHGVAFERGWRLLRGGEPAQAAEAFRDVLRESGGDGLQEDATFWLGVAQARAGASTDARATLALFIASYPRSVRAGEASALLGWLLIDAHDLAGARRAFLRATNDPVDRVRASATSGLEKLSAQ